LGLRISWDDERIRASAYDVFPQSAQDVLLGGQIPGPIPGNVHHLDDNPFYKGVALAILVDEVQLQPLSGKVLQLNIQCSSTEAAGSFLSNEKVVTSINIMPYIKRETSTCGLLHLILSSSYFIENLFYFRRNFVF
jgi:hypothetical protein